MTRASLSTAVARTRRPRRNAVLLGVLVVIVVVAVGWFFVLTPRMSQAEELSAQAEEIEIANLSTQHRLTDLVDMAQKAPEAALRVQSLLERMPQQADLPALFDQITQAAIDSGIDPGDISTITQSIPIPLKDAQGSAVGPISEALESAAATSADIARLDLSVSVSGTRNEVVEFTRRLAALDRNVLIGSVTVSNPSGLDDGATLASITGTTFILKSTLPDLVANVDDVLQSAGVSTTG